MSDIKMRYFVEVFLCQDFVPVILQYFVTQYEAQQFIDQLFEDLDNKDAVAYLRHYSGKLIKIIN